MKIEFYTHLIEEQVNMINRYRNYFYGAQRSGYFK